ncbi:hypothetical protein AB0B89_18355 [Sphaerisporangium sp. NPDC049002]|uniref:hypothetical protein n=1 Tax=Sphaerisporangium sp. NPDC049002 TaxID=3155392 RepID=UPI0034027485
MSTKPPLKDFTHGMSIDELRENSRQRQTAYRKAMEEMDRELDELFESMPPVPTRKGLALAVRYRAINEATARRSRWWASAPVGPGDFRKALHEAAQAHTARTALHQAAAGSRVLREAWTPDTAEDMAIAFDEAIARAAINHYEGNAR